MEELHALSARYIYIFLIYVAGFIDDLGTLGEVCGFEMPRRTIQLDLSACLLWLFEGRRGIRSMDEGTVAAMPLFTVVAWLYCRYRRRS